MNRQTKIQNLRNMIEDLQDKDLDAIYNIVWNTTAKDLIIKSMESRLK